MDIATPRFLDHPNATSDVYVSGVLDLAKALPSWRQSLISYKWLGADAQPKKPDELADEQRAQYEDILRILTRGDALPKPIIGLGMFDNVEVGSGAAIVATLAALDVKVIPVHMRVAQEKGLRKFLL